MRLFCVFLLGFSSVLSAASGEQTSSAATPGAATTVPSDAVVATVEGKTVTASQVAAMLQALPPEMRSGAEANKKEFLRQYAMLLQLAADAEKAGLTERSPYKEALEHQRLTTLAQAELNEALNRISIPEADVKKYYDLHKERYTEVAAKVIYIPFSNTPAKTSTSARKSLTEPEAMARAEKVYTDALAGMDFVKLVKQYSEDKTSVEKDGDFGAIKATDNLPDPVKVAIFSLKEGEVSKPVRQPNGFYLFQATKISPQEFSSVRDQIYEQLRQEQWKFWLETKRAEAKVTFDNEEFFTGPATPPAAASSGAAGAK
jgi:parvulin-like peptidyl-prolyl isomerase